MNYDSNCLNANLSYYLISLNGINIVLSAKNDWALLLMLQCGNREIVQQNLIRLFCRFDSKSTENTPQFWVILLKM